MAVRKRIWASQTGDRKSAWQVDYRDQLGKRRSKQFRTKKEADNYADRAKSEIRQGIHTHDRDSITIADAAKLRIAAAEAEDLERSTIKRYKELHRLHIVDRLGQTKLSALSKADVENFRLELLTNLSRSMAVKVIRELSAILSNAQAVSAVAQNVAAKVRFKSGKRERVQITPPNRADLKSMISAATDTERPLILTAILTGLRSSELRGLRWEDIDLTLGTVTVRQRADEWGVIGPPKSKAGRRTIPIPTELVSELKRWKLRSPPSKIGLAFPSGRGTPLRHGNVLRRLYFPLQVRAGLADVKRDDEGAIVSDAEGRPIMVPRYSFHELRHAAASGWIANNIDLKRLQTWIGHENIQLTLDTYGHLLKDAQKDAELAKLASRDLFSG